MPGRVGESFDEVMSAAQAGAGWAAGRRWAALAPGVAGYLAAQGAAESEDLTREVFIGVFRSLGTFSGSEEQFGSWVFNIAHRRLTDERRRFGRRPAPVGGLVAEHGPSGSRAEHEALRRLSVERVRTLCDRLVPDQRDVVLLRLVGGLTVEEVVAALDESEGAVKALQGRVGRQHPATAGALARGGHKRKVPPPDRPTSAGRSGARSRRPDARSSPSPGSSQSVDRRSRSGHGTRSTVRRDESLRPPGPENGATPRAFVPPRWVLDA